MPDEFPQPLVRDSFGDQVVVIDSIEKFLQIKINARHDRGDKGRER
jgi:hypothetical protein